MIYEMSSMFAVSLSYVVRPRAHVVVDSAHFSSAEISSVRRTQHIHQKPCGAHPHCTSPARDNGVPCSALGQSDARAQGTGHVNNKINQ